MPNLSVEEFIKSPERRKAYAEWLANPMTKAVFELAEEFNRTRRLSQAVPAGPGALECAALGSYLALGRDEILEFMQSLSKLTDAPEQLARKYGEDSILMSEFGYPASDARRNATESGRKA